MSVNKPTHYPTHQLRFVERIESAGSNSFVVRVLQQLWETSYLDLKNEWRDVPVEKEGEAGA